VYTKTLLYKAYVNPIANYGIECTIYGEKEKAAIDKIHVQYCRWALGIIKRSNHLQTLRECRINPMQTEIDKAQASYLLTALTRDHTHLTTAALEHIWLSPHSRMHKQWLKPTLENIKRWNHPKIKLTDLTPNNKNFMENFPDHKAARKLNAWVKTQCREDRNHECHGHEDKRQGPPPTQNKTHQLNPLSPQLADKQPSDTLKTL